MRASLEDRLLRRRVIDTETGCWRWTGYKQHGYGRMTVGTRMPRVHRVAYELWVGPIPEGLVLDHVYARGCRYRDCFNPDHLEPVEHAENCRRRMPDLKETCIRGHFLDRSRPRGCRICKTMLQRERRRLVRLGSPNGVDP